jgi:putative PIN family toxin of toxin-antitoxin system
VRVVLDTNVVVSALLFEHGRLLWLRTAWMQGRCRPLVSAATVEELVRVLAYPKFRLSVDEREEILGDYLPFVEVVTVSRRSAAAPRCADPDDQMFLELGVAGHAALIVTGDEKLLGVTGSCPFKVVSPAQAHSILVKS